eukprot:6200577-Pleurochrysis_carterae.AAC.1
MQRRKGTFTLPPGGAAWADSSRLWMVRSRQRRCTRNGELRANGAAVEHPRKVGGCARAEHVKARGSVCIRWRWALSWRWA